MPPTLGVIIERLDNFMLGTRQQHEAIRLDVEKKHLQNRSSIHDLKNDIQRVNDLVSETKLEITTLKVKLAMYASIGGIGAGIITAVVTSVIQRFLFK